MLRSASSTSKQSSVDDDSPQLSFMTRMPLGLSAVRHLWRKRRKWESVRWPTHHCAQITSYVDGEGVQSCIGAARKRHFDAQPPTSTPSTVDVLEPARTLREAACAFVDAKDTVEGIEVGAMAAKCRFLAAPMQDWAPSSSSYDVIWAQWSVAV